MPQLTETLRRLDRLTNWEARPRGEMRVGLAPIAGLLAALGNPQTGLRIVHVGGTKGKGSVCALIDAALRANDLRTVRYASPHLTSVTERIIIDGQPVDDTTLSDTLLALLDIYEVMQESASDEAAPTWFDVLTAAAFAIFSKTTPDWAVIEVGLGGRLDSTNVADSRVAVITNIELEHTDVLGRTRAEIAYQKAGILKPGRIGICGVRADDPVAKVFREEAARVGCEIHFPITDMLSIDEHNQALAATALDEIGRREGAPGVGGHLLTREVVEVARLPGRLEWMPSPAPTGGGSVPILLDGAHVAESVSAVMRSVEGRRHVRGAPIPVIAMGADKDASRFVAELLPYTDTLVTTSLPGRRDPLQDEKLAAAAREQGAQVSFLSDPVAALATAIAMAETRGGWVLVTGSLHLVGHIRTWLKRQRSWLA